MPETAQREGSLVYLSNTTTDPTFGHRPPNNPSKAPSSMSVFSLALSMAPNQREGLLQTMISGRRCACSPSGPGASPRLLANHLEPLFHRETQRDPCRPYVGHVIWTLENEGPARGESSTTVIMAYKGIQTAVRRMLRCWFTPSAILQTSN